MENKVPTKEDWKRFNKQFTTRELPTVDICGHKLDKDNPPHNKCDYCWFLFFNEDGEWVKELHELFSQDKGKTMTAKLGKLFTKQFVRFMSTVASWQKRK